LSHHAGNAMLTSPLLKACQQNLSSYALEALLHDFFKAKFPNHWFITWDKELRCAPIQYELL
jgi:hypothetical protein